jgi:hypothetical protein
MLDTSKIISNAVEESINGIVNKNPSELPNIGNQKYSDSIKQDELLMNYSNNLLNNYHNALKEELAKQGIII